MRTSFAALTTEFAPQTRTLSRSRAPRSKRHADGTSPTQDGQLSKHSILLEPERVGKFRVLGNSKLSLLVLNTQDKSNELSTDKNL